MASDKDNSSFSMLDLFRTEVAEQGDVLTVGLLALETGSAESKLEALMRAAHSIKGAAKLVGVEPVVKIAHVAEDAFVAAQNGEIVLGSDHVDVLLNAVDRIISISRMAENDIVQWQEKHADELDELVKSITAIKSGEKFTAKSSAKPAGKQKSTKPKSTGKSNKGSKPAESRSKSRQSKTAPVVQANKAAELAQHEKLEDQKHRKQSSTSPRNGPAVVDHERVLKVTAERWNQLMGLAGEVWVEAGWLHPHVSALAVLKRRQIELSEMLDSMRSALDYTNVPKSVVQLLLQAQKKISECRSLLSAQMSDLDLFDRRITSLTERLHRETINTRMRPFSDGIHGFQRMVRDIAKSLGKKVNLEIYGLDILVDRDVLEKMEAPMNHMLRNSLDHGIETPEDRIKVGKPEQGTIRLTAVHSDGMLSIMIEDDGRGIDIEHLRRKVCDKKLVTKEMADHLSEKELLEFLFLPSFSTRDEVTDLSGRGVGLDVVLSTVQMLHGSIETLTRLGEGTRFHMRLPLAMSVVSALIAEISGEPYAFPLARIVRAVKLPSRDIEILEDHQFAVIDGENIGLVGASQVLGLGSQLTSDDELSVIILGDRHSRCGIVVDRLLGQKDLALQSLDPRLGKVPDVSSASVLEDGSPVLILDIDDLVVSVDNLIKKGSIAKVTKSEDDTPEKVMKNILVVDDSLTVREVERNLLENAGYHVDAAVDGVDGWNAIRAFKKYDLIVTDIDMPRMDGIELVRLIKSDKIYSSIPVIIVSYKEREADRRRCMEAGADFYLTKGSFHDDSLLEAVADLIGDVEG